MCKECGCEEKVDKQPRNDSKIMLNQSVNAVNDSLATDISHSLVHKGILCVNIMGSPGSGKTSFIEGICRFIDPKSVAVIQGDLESDIDKRRLEKAGIYTYQINTHSGCHLNALMINKALLEMDLTGKKYLLIENVGNLVCPAGMKIGQHRDIVVSSTTEGTDKPKKYPYIFMDAAIIVISKYDIKEHVAFNEALYRKDLKNINGQASIYVTSSKDPESFKNPALEIVHEREHIIGSHSH